MLLRTYVSIYCVCPPHVKEAAHDHIQIFSIIISDDYDEKMIVTNNFVEKVTQISFTGISFSLLFLGLSFVSLQLSSISFCVNLKNDEIFQMLISYLVLF